MGDIEFEVDKAKYREFMCSFGPLIHFPVGLKSKFAKKDLEEKIIDKMIEINRENVNDVRIYEDDYEN